MSSPQGTENTADLSDPLCNPSPCGNNTKCSESEGKAICSCLHGYKGNPLSFCWPECSHNSECPTDKVCVSPHCINSCNLRSTCGPLAECVAANHTKISCHCPRGFTGDPKSSIGCKPTAKESPKDDPCLLSPCGFNANCTLRRGIAICSCPDGFNGNPFIRCDPLCSDNLDCPEDRSCVNSRCVDPCLISRGCGPGAECIVVNHTGTSCHCAPGLTGNPQSQAGCQSMPPTDMNSSANQVGGDSIDIRDMVTTTQQPTSEITLPSHKHCTLPVYQHNRYTQYGCPGCYHTGGDAVNDGQLIVITCASGSQLLYGNKAYIRCFEGVWEPNIPQCYTLCPPLTPLTLDLECWQGPTQVACDQPMLPNTTVRYSCKQYYETTSNSHPAGLRCGSSGSWSGELPVCTPRCGQSNLNSAEVRPTIVDGRVPQEGNFPWHANLFHNVSGKWESKCGGTLISTRAVLTAAHCVTKDTIRFKSPVMEVENVMVALGKFYRNWYTSEEAEIKRSVEHIHVHPNYVGSPQNYGQDIAVLILEKELPINRFIMPVCMDYHKKHISQLFFGSEGYVAGWGNTEECNAQGSVCNTPSENLKYGRTTIMDFNMCYNTTQSIKGFLLSRLTPDKFCAGNGSESVVQKGDSGGGLTFVFDGLHYVYGVVSVKLKLQLKEHTYYSFGAFTNVPVYLDWLSSKLF